MNLLPEKKCIFFTNNIKALQPQPKNLSLVVRTLFTGLRLCRGSEIPRTSAANARLAPDWLCERHDPGPDWPVPTALHVGLQCAGHLFLRSHLGGRQSAQS